MRVGILAYSYPPCDSIGAMRPAGWVRYLPEFGIEPIVVTRHWDGNLRSSRDHVEKSSIEEVRVKREGGALIVRAPFIPDVRDRMILRFGLERFAGPRKMLSLILSCSQMATLAWDHHAPVFRAALDHFRKEPCDLLIATGGPFVLFRYAHLLSKKLRIPWIADYRDGWTTSEELSYSSLHRRILQKTFFRLAEKKYLQSAALITTAAPSYAESLAKLHENIPVQVVLNGFDDETVSYLRKDGVLKDSNFALDPSERMSTPESGRPVGDRTLVIFYGGTLYEHQPVERFFDGLDLFVKMRPSARLKVRFVGTGFHEAAGERIRRLTEKAPYSVEIVPRMDYRNFLIGAASAHLLLLLSRKDSGWLNAKIFDYLAVRRRIILVERDGGVLDGIIRETGAGLSGSTPGEIARIVSDAYDALHETGDVVCVSEGWEKYGRRGQTEILANLAVKVGSRFRLEKGCPRCMGPG